MYTARCLKLRAESDSGCQSDNGWSIVDLPRFQDSGLNAIEIKITVLDMLSVPTVGFETLHDILSESALSVSIFNRSACSACQVMI